MEQSDITRSRLRGKAVRYLALRDFDASIARDSRRGADIDETVRFDRGKGREKLERLRGKIGTFSARDDFGTGRRNDGDGEATHLTEN